MKDCRMLLNCDLGEFEGEITDSADLEIIPLIDMANVACGFHAGSSRTMDAVARLAAKHGVKIGAHPSFNDRENFGRKHQELSGMEISGIVLQQIDELQRVTQPLGLNVDYVKPHGALYHAMMAEENVFRAILTAIQSRPSLSQLMIFSTPRNGRYAAIAAEYGVSLLYEGFADRAYNENGMLVPRSVEGAVITDLDAVKSQVDLLKGGKVKAQDGTVLNLSIDTICVHGDTPNALKLIRRIREWL